MTISIEDIRRDADELAAIEIVVETNEGTYGDREAVRKCGSGDPTFADYHVYQRVGDGSHRRSGCDAARAPGRARRVGRAELADRQRELAELRKQIRNS